jgi:hypothetical protein
MIHKNLKNWDKLNFASKMANIGSEAIRVLSWGNSKNSEDSLARFVQLLELTISQEESIPRKSELEILKKYFIKSIKKNELRSQQQVRNYFIDFALLTRKFS